MIMTQAKERGATAERMPGTVEMIPTDGTYSVECSCNPKELARRLDNNEADFVVVGAVLPARSGAELCRLLRTNDGNMQYPVLLLRSADGNTTNSRRMVSESRSLQTDRFMTESDPKAIALDDIQIHPGRHEVTVQGEVVDLTATEFRLLRLFTEQPGWVFSRDQIIDAIRGKGYSCTPRSVDVLIVGLRRKLGKLGRRIQTIRGVGYRYRE